MAALGLMVLVATATTGWRPRSDRGRRLRPGSPFSAALNVVTMAASSAGRSPKMSIEAVPASRRRVNSSPIDRRWCSPRAGARTAPFEWANPARIERSRSSCFRNTTRAALEHNPSHSREADTGLYYAATVVAPLAGVAQSAEHRHGKAVVRGSIPRSGSALGVLRCAGPPHNHPDSAGPQMHGDVQLSEIRRVACPW